jgi:two-component system OmpR family sensor kinase/two-component system sensor histidine kinase BaeS
MGKKRQHWHRHRPPWWTEEHRKDWEDWKRHSRPPWRDHRRDKEEWRTSGPGLFLRFAVAFGIFVLLGCGFLAFLGTLAMFIFRSLPPTVPPSLPDPGMEPPPFRWILGLAGAVVVLALALRWVGRRTAHRFTEPLSETMKAADALAEGDLSARVPEAGGREFGRFTRSFNRMAEALETADRQRRELLADVAHELRTPLTVIQGNLEGLRDGIYEATPDHLDLVLDEARKLGHLVDDLRLLTLAEAGQLPLDLQVLDVGQLLADVRDTFAYQAGEVGITLEADEARALPPLVADPQRLGQVLGNLVTNALRHTPPGGVISLGADLENSDGTPQLVRLWVADTGEGIPAADLPRIFDRFWRGDPARTRETGAGSGLGLAIAKSLVEAHGGRIWAESQVDEGTMVSCFLPLSASPAPL